MRIKDIAMLLLLAALWGASFLFIRIDAPAFGPFVLVELRVALAALTLILFALASGHRIRVLHKWRAYLILGAANAAVPFTLISFAELRLDAGLAAILNATTPMFTALVALVWLNDPFTLKKLSGVVLGIIGVGISLGYRAGSHGPHLWIFASCSLVAAVFYGIAGVFSSRHFKGERPMDMAIGQQLAASLVLLPLSLATMPHEMPSEIAILSLLALAVFCTAVAYLFYFSLIQSVGAVKTLTVTFLVPLFGVLWGALFLSEPITIKLIVGMLIIFASVSLVARGKSAHRANK